MTMTIPHSTEAEASLLGIALVSPDAARRAMEHVQAADFYVPRHEAIFGVMEQLAREGGCIDPITVAGRMRLPVVDLIEMTRQVHQPVPVALEMAHVVAAKAAFRRALSFADRVTEAALVEDIDALDEAFIDPLGEILPESRSERVDAADLVMEEHEVEYVLPHLLARHEVAIWVGEPGHGKSTLLRQIGVCVASGLTPFHRSATEVRRVLIVDCQDSRATTAQGLRPLLALVGDRYQGGLEVELHPQGMDLSSALHQRWLDEAVAGSRADLVILGPLYNLVRGAANRSKQSEETAELAMNALTDLMVRRNCALMIEAHSPHGDDMRVRGSKLWEDFPDFGFGLVKEDSDSGRAMRVVRFRGDRHTGRRWPSRFVQGEPGDWPWEVV